MSLHIESTENALAELKKQRTKTLTAAISVSFLGIALMGLLLYLVHIIVAVPEDPPMVAYATQEGDNPDIDTPEVTQTTQRPSSSSTSAQVKVIAAVATADVAVVNPDIEVDVPSEELSMGIDIGDGFGTGTGDGDGGGIPGIISKRCDLNDRMKRITENGGTPQCEEAVVKSLRWLKKQQNKDGSWGGAPHNYKCAMTGMALLSYLAHCETPLSEEFGETVLKGISFLVDQGMKNPVLSLVPQRNEVSYDHAVATYALCEAYTFCKQMDIPSISNLEKVVIKAVDKIVDNQNTDGGAARKGLDWIKNNVKTLQWGQGSGTENVKSNLYMHYYCVQAAMNRGGDVWTSYNKAFRDAVLSGQNADGSFRKNDVGYVSGMSNKSENIYRQCLATLMLETYYRFLPGTGEGTKNS